MNAIKNLLFSIWTFLCLHLAAFTFCVLVSELFYAIEGYSSKYNSGVEGVSEFFEIFRDYSLIFLSPPTWLYAGAIIAFVMICKTSKRIVFWPLASGFCFWMLVVSLLIFNSHAHILKYVVRVGLPLYTNVSVFIVISVLFSPAILFYLKIPGARLWLSDK